MRHLEATLRCASCGYKTTLRGVSVGRTNRAPTESVAEAYADIAFPDGVGAWPIWERVRSRLASGEDPGEAFDATWAEKWKVNGRDDD